LLRKLPNREFWASLAGLVRDGASFSLRRGPAPEPLLAAEGPTLQSDPNEGRLARSAAVDASAEVVAKIPPARESAAEAKARALREQRDQSVHSSQQPIKVIGATAASAPPAELNLPGDNSQQLKAVLGKQGTTAARITLSQLTAQENRQVKSQLKKLGLSTEGSAAELKDRLKQAQGGGGGASAAVQG
jgi:hypothetical protein